MATSQSGSKVSISTINSKSALVRFPLSTAMSFQTRWYRLKSPSLRSVTNPPSANVLDSLRRHEINVEEVDNQIFEGAATACCAIRLGSEPPPGCLDEIRARHDEVLYAALIPLPE